MRVKIVILIAAAALAPSVARSQGDNALAGLVASSDVVALADIRGGSLVNGTYSATITARRVLKGQNLLLPSATVQVNYPAPLDGRPIAPIDVDEFGLVFLRESSSGWRLATVNSSGQGLRSGFLPVERGAATQAGGGGEIIASEDAVTEVLVAAIEAEGPYGELGPKLLVSPSGHPEVYVRWSNSSDAKLRVYGLMGRLMTGDEQAIIRAAKEWASLSQAPRSNLLASALSSVRTSSPAAIHALGELATAESEHGISPAMRQGLALALSAIHSDATLSYLAKLLDSGDILTRSVAVAGFSSFVTGMRVAQDSSDAAEALDEVLNPGRRRSLPNPDAPFETEETRKYVHFGPFKDPAEESEHIAFWKSWYERNASRLTAPK